MNKEKLLDAARTLRQMCESQPDCTYCPFAKDKQHCTINTVPQMWGERATRGMWDDGMTPEMNDLRKQEKENA